MNLLLICIASAVVLIVAYRLYGALLARLLRLDDSRPTPAHTRRDDTDFVPIAPKFLLGQHFSAIAAAGPIVGPILAGVAFGWGPALIWILLGSILIGGVHDMASLVASIRHKARSIAEVVRLYMSRRSYLLFLTFIWVALVYIIVAFTDVVAGSFVGSMTIEDGTRITGGGIASSSLMYLALPIIMGLLLRYTRLSLAWTTVIFLPLVGVAIWAGQRVPLDLSTAFGISEIAAIKAWDVLLLGYCLLAGMAPVWLLLQPRGHLGGYFLYVALVGSLVGIVLSAFQGGATVQYPAFIGWHSAKGEPLFPILFITVACGACSGFHCLIASGTTSKQLRRESDAKVIGYGAMLLEAMVAVVALACVMILARDNPTVDKGPNFIYAAGLGRFLGTLGVPQVLGISFGLLAFTTFVYDTLDVCTRLGRYIIQELTGWQSKAGGWFATAATASVPLFFVTRTSVDPVTGNAIPAWKMFWSLFGASNQLLAALALLGVTVWLWSTRRAVWALFVTGLPALWMYTVSVWALITFIRRGFIGTQGQWIWPGSPVPWTAVVLVALAAVLLIETVLVFIARRPPTGASPMVPDPV